MAVILFLQGQPTEVTAMEVNRVSEVQVVELGEPLLSEDLNDDTENIEEYIEQKLVEYDLPDEKLDTSFKAYMDYRTITDKSSDQWKLQQKAYTDENGFRRIGDDYCVAVTNYYAGGECGTRLRVTLEDETMFTAIVSDIKNSNETDIDNMYHPVNETMVNVIEFVVDADVLCDFALLLGSVSCLGLEGNIVKIERID